MEISMKDTIKYWIWRNKIMEYTREVRTGHYIVKYKVPKICQK